MCIIIDTNTLASVFDRESENHDSFAPVYNWIFTDKGKIVFGGTKYKAELKKSFRYLKLFGQLSRIRKTIEIDDDLVDNYQKELERKVVHRDFDDPHLVAILHISKCKLICTNEKRAVPYITNKDFYDKGFMPKIYSRKSNSSLLNNNNIANICQPCIKLNKQTVETFEKIIKETIKK
ncbi:hypothetical protein [Chryseobacterium oncorhynchi]|uniref:PIN domain-containing protein n=1 Tax=Chryseobacterium oncorhynchi TaxID=741074 RepID=A0A316WQ68_9FLAO|nr:hypothetical protein [Chryseobacterium oncorhynchi]PWN63289.1 hypothetical protein C1638_014570 [Chryseobacterium oncorhynchi]